LHYIVIKPVRAMSSKADDISMGNLTVEELSVSGSDEIASLGRSFNRMHRSLTNAVKMLDETMDP
jgi:nitrate/nitrite-specific signal transduction histidine kinase